MQKRHYFGLMKKPLTQCKISKKVLPEVFLNFCVIIYFSYSFLLNHWYTLGGKLGPKQYPDQKYQPEGVGHFAEVKPKNLKKNIQLSNDV